MRFVGYDIPLNAVSDVDPHLAGKKSQNLPALVLTLSADFGLPGLALGGYREKQRRQE
jgi:hypothetical protein